MTQQRKTNRREFLRGKSAKEAVDSMLRQFDAAAEAEPTPADGCRARRAPIVRLTRDAMACQFEVWLPALSFDGGEESAVEALDLVDRLEDQLSVYRADSELTRINRQAAQCELAVEPRLFELFRLCLQLHEQTSGAFDVTSGPLSKAWGFFRREGRMPTPEELQSTLAHVGSGHVVLDSAQRTVRFAVAGVEINLGGVGKGYALDRAAETLRSGEVADFMLHGGQSSVLAHGTRFDGDEPSPGWTVRVRDPLRPQETLGRIRLCDQALGTSGSARQRFYHQGRRYGHILDPRTGWPVEGVLSSTVVAPTAAVADALSTAFYVMGPDQTAEYCRQHPEIGAVLVCPGQRGASLVVKRFGEVVDWIS